MAMYNCILYIYDTHTHIYIYKDIFVFVIFLSNMLTCVYLGSPIRKGHGHGNAIFLRIDVSFWSVRDFTNQLF